VFIFHFPDNLFIFYFRKYINISWKYNFPETIMNINFSGKIIMYLFYFPDLTTLRNNTYVIVYILFPDIIFRKT